jgi:hypothetical protein
MTKLILAAFAATTLMATASSASAGGRCPPEACNFNGTQLSGIASGSIRSGVTAVILPSGNILDLR